jgi:nucleoside-diphosphate-sugar epimerase
MAKKIKRQSDGKLRVLVTGGAGYVGGAVTDLLAAMPERYEFRVYDSLLYEESYRKPVPFVFGDILDREKLQKELEWADAVIWLAAIVGDGACAWDEVLTTKTNQESLAWLKDNFKGRIIFASTCSVYGAQEKELLTETSALKPLSLYAYTKVEAEKILKDSDAIIFRLGTLFGLSDLFSRIRMDLVANLLTARALMTGEINIFGGEQYRPLLHVKDAASAFVSALEVPKLSHAEIYNLSLENIRMFDLAKLIQKHFPKVKVNVTEMPFEDLRNYSASAEKAIRELNFHPTHTLDEGITEVASLLSDKRVKDFSNPRYSNQTFLKNIFNK